MHFDLTEEQQAIRTLVRDFALGEVRPVAEELDRTKSFPYEIVRKLPEGAQVLQFGGRTLVVVDQV